MGVRTGIDLVDVADVGEALERFGERYLARIFTPSELVACGPAGSTRRVERLAACIAAKEAAFKVLSSGDDTLPWRCVEVTRKAAGELSLQLSGAALACAEREGIASLSLSVTSRQDTAAAVVLAEIRSPPETAETEDADTA